MSQAKAPNTAESLPFSPTEVSSHMQQFAAQWAAVAHEQLDRLVKAVEHGSKLAQAWQSAAFDTARRSIDFVAQR